MTRLGGVRALTFDLFGTVLDLGGSLEPPVGRWFAERGIDADPAEFWAQWRARQRIEQYQDNILLLGHSGYLETCRRALRYTLRLNRIDSDDGADDEIMAFWQDLHPYPEVLDALHRLKKSYDLVALSNGDPHFLEHLATNRIGWDFDAIISVAEIGAFKPHPAVYRHAAARLGLEPAECFMVSANSFDVLGARACGFRAAFVNRQNLPYEDSPLQPDLTVSTFTELADALL
ncbi:MAG: haloacid dehalogenase type II [Dehalococcoidia bacterium]|nr:haloacid dehalogenase type II [Dehalococcoidia bacterium]MYA53938.1 haloacid dehalogenase type II [Dehalococcoidia bacterium]